MIIFSRRQMFLSAFLVLSFIAWAGGEVCAQQKPVFESVIERATIDPGHGGKDKGVIGPGGLTESDLAYDLAIRFQTALENNLGLTVNLTRTESESPNLTDRTAAANRLAADLMISIHASGSLNDSESGFAVYFQSYRLQAGLSDPAKGDEAADDWLTDGAVGWTTAQTPYIKASRRLAWDLTRDLRDVLRIKGADPLGLPLAVIAGARCPAILIEVGSLTNPEEERRLSRPGYREALTRALVQGIKTWRHWYVRQID